MKVEQLDLHGFSLTEAMNKFRNSLEWCVKNQTAALVINHGKGFHSERGLSVIKQELRRILKEDPATTSLLKEHGYKVIFGESDYPVALSFNAGQTLIVIRGMEKEHLGGTRQQEKHQQIFSDEGQQKRRAEKKSRQQKDKRRH